MLDQKELQRKSELLKEQKIKQIKNNIRTNCLKVLEFPEVIENIILEYYFFDVSKIETNKSLKEKVNTYYTTKNAYLISELDVSCVTSMNSLFCCFYLFNESLDKWDTSYVVDMCCMFHYCENFNQPVNFNTSKVIDMNSMFYDCTKFNQSVEFDTSNVTNMCRMFYQCVNFNQPVNFNTSKVSDMHCMFMCCIKFNHPVNFDTSNVKYNEYMFKFCNSLEEKNKMLIMH